MRMPPQAMLKFSHHGGDNSHPNKNALDMDILLPKARKYISNLVIKCSILSSSKIILDITLRTLFCTSFLPPVPLARALRRNISLPYLCYPYPPKELPTDSQWIKFC